MIKTLNKQWHINRTLLGIGLLCLFGLFMPLAGYAQTPTVTTVPTAADMLKNIADQLPNIKYMLGAVAYVMGIYFVVMGVIRFKHMGEMRSMMSHEHSIKAPIIFLVVGALLIYLPSSIQVGMSTFWTTPNPFGYIDQKQQQWAELMKAIFIIIQLVGIIAFIRGLLILSSLSQGGGHQNAFGKGITHIIGGIFCINMYQFVQVVLITLGLSLS